MSQQEYQAEKAPSIEMQAIEPGGKPLESNDVSMGDTQGSDPSTSQDDSLESIYPCLGPPSPRWREDLVYLLENLGRSYLTDMDTEFTQEVCQRLPSLADTMVQCISRLSGCLMSARAVVYDYENTSSIKAFSVLSDSIPHCFYERDARDDTYNFVHNALRAIGQGLERQPSRIYPVIYSSPFWRGRPVLPPKHLCVEQRRAQLQDWMGVLQLWQGLQELSMQQIAARVASGYPPPFAPNVDTCYDWVYDHQVRIYAGDQETELTAPQFMEDNAEEPYRKEGQPVARNYSEHSAYYFQVMQHFRFDKNVYMPLIVKDPRWFTVTVVTAWQSLLTPEVKDLLDLVEQNRLMSPPERQIDHSDPPFLSLMPTTDCDLVAFPAALIIPNSVYMWNDQYYNLYNILSLWQYVGVRKALVQDGKVAGGLTGAFQVVMTLVTLLWLKQQLQSGRIPPSDGIINWGPTEDEQVKQIALTLSKQLRDSIDSTDRPLIHQGAMIGPWTPSRLTIQTAGIEEIITHNWPYEGFGVYNKPPRAVEGSDDDRGDDNVAESPANAVAKPQEQVLDLTTPSPAAPQEDDMRDAMALSPPLAATPPEPTSTTYPASTQQVYLPAGALASASKSPANIAFAETPSFAANALNTDSDDDNPWQPYRVKLEKSMQQSVPTRTGEPAKQSVPRTIVRPSTDKIRTNDLPETYDATLSRRARSLGPPQNSQALTGPIGNTLGLSHNPFDSSLVPGNTSIGFPSFTSTPQAAARLTTAHPALLAPVMSQESRGSSNRGVPGASGSLRPQSTSSARSRTASINAETADRTVTGSLLDVAARIFTQPEAGVASVGEPRPPAVSAAPTRRIITRHAAQKAASKRSRPEEGSPSTQAAPKKSKSHERDRNKK
ncbi:hypothetical protein RSAG8_07190, partial [Rhizoctonia solani AG-8 WAC10335]